MSQTIIRMYATPEQANQAAEELANCRFDHFPDVHVVGRSSGPGAASSSADDIVAALTKAFVLKAHAKVLAQGVMRGGALVVAHARFGSANTAIEILERHHPIDSGLADFEDRPLAWDDAAPCSSLLHMPVLLPDSATFSKFWNVRALAKKATTTFSAFGLPETVRSSGPYAGLLGLPLISNKATLLSSMLGMPVLSKPKAARKR